MKRIEAGQFDDPALQAEFAGVAARLLTDLDYPVELDSVATLGEPGKITAYAETGQAYCKVSTRMPPFVYSKLTELETERVSAPHLFNGLLLDKQGDFRVPPDTASEWGSVMVRVVSSPEAYNTAARQMGRTPGVNAMQVVAGRPGDTPVGKLTEGWADRSAISSALVSADDTAFHDLAVRGHALPPLVLDPLALDQSVHEAERLATHPDLASQIDNEIGKGAPEFENFAGGVEDLPLITMTLVDAVWSAARNHELIPSIDRKIQSMANRHKSAPILAKLGIVSPDLSEESRRQTYVTLRRTVQHITGMMLAAEEIHPTPGMLRIAHILRKRSLGKIAAAFAA
jgi:hypothetical protein